MTIQVQLAVCMLAVMFFIYYKYDPCETNIHHTATAFHLALKYMNGLVRAVGLSANGLQGYLAHQKQPPPLGPPWDPR